MNAEPDFDAAPALDDVETQASDDEHDDHDDDLTQLLRKELGESSLDDDAEDELMRELAEVTAETHSKSEIAADILTDIEDDAPIAIAQDADESADIEEDDLKGENDFRLEDAIDEDTQDDADSDHETRNVFDTSDESMSRLLDTAEREMGDGENTRRRNAIQHLKAAVAATRAEQTDSPEVAQAQEEAEADPYREDLARVVRPRRPSEAAAAGARRLAPLMLVSEQRIDAPQDVAHGANITPVRPRRISSAALALQEEEQFASDEGDQAAEPRHQNPMIVTDNTETFADYVETVGAEGLSDLLEAAAAYSSFVEGRETVTRPQIMRLASEAMPEEFPLEERLRSFGQLLRQGKIRKIKRGHFVVANGTRFKPEAAAS
jgi:hypothetical protein